MNSPSSPPDRQIARRSRCAGLLLLGVLLLLVGCGTQTKRKWLTFFFDGVPVPGSTNVAPALASAELEPKPTPVAPVLRTNFFPHPPYEDQKCSACHVSRFSVKIRGGQKQACFACHKDFLTPAKRLHQPAENGECSSCHEPHGGPNAKLLVRPNPSLCFKCHNDFPTDVKVVHQPVEDGLCQKCHSPHASAAKALLIKPEAELCFSCHDDFQAAVKKAKFKHDPVDDDKCVVCHNPHQSKESKLLRKDARQLCLRCHDPKEMLAVKGHAQAGNRGCLVCHDPHLGKDKYLLKAGAVQPPKEVK